MTYKRFLHSHAKTHLIGLAGLFLLIFVLIALLWNSEPDVRIGWHPVNAQVQALLQGENATSLDSSAKVSASKPKLSNSSSHIPLKSSEVETAVSSSTQDPVGGIDLNAASMEQLITLPGIGPSKAKAILQYREKAGRFRSVEELERVKGIGAKTVNLLRSYVFVGETK